MDSAGGRICRSETDIAATTASEPMPRVKTDVSSEAAMTSLMASTIFAVDTIMATLNAKRDTRVAVASLKSTSRQVGRRGASKARAIA